MKKILLGVFCIVIANPLFALTIVSDSEKSQSMKVSGFWSSNQNLTYNSTAYGDTYYNYKWQDMSVTGNIEHEDVFKWVLLKPYRKCNWSVQFHIQNLNAEKNKNYFCSTDKKKHNQSSSQIYWGVCVGYKANGVERSSCVWIKRSDPEYLYGNTESYDSCEKIMYSVDGGSWQMSNTFSAPYPSCKQDNRVNFSIDIRESKSVISWGSLKITELPLHIDEIRYIKVLVGTQAKVQIGNITAVADFYPSDSTLGSWFDNRNENSIIRALGKAPVLTETEALYLAMAYIASSDFERSIELSTAIINFNGSRKNEGYYYRGLANLLSGRTQEALQDYTTSGHPEVYYEIYEDLYGKKNVETSPKKASPSQNQNKNSKPALTK